MTNEGVIRITSNKIKKNIFRPFSNTTSGISTGTGFFIDKYHILTCYHVVSDSISVYITFPFKTKDKIEVDIVSFCSECDVALLKLKEDYNNSYYLEIGDSDSINKGDTSMALGYPLGTDNLKITKGTISGYNNFFLQTDTAINPGNSGGPLVDEHNNVIGINTQKVVEEGVDNTGYSVPIKFVLDLWFKDLKIDPTKLTKIKRKPQLLFKYYNLTSEYLEYNNINPNITGIIIKLILEKSPLYKSAGVRANDILHKINGNIIDNFGDLNVDWAKDKIHINTFLLRQNVDDLINVEYYSLTKKELIEREILLEEHIFPIREIYPILDEEYEYEVLGGMIISQLTLNHLYNLDNYNNISFSKIYNLLKYKKEKNRLEPILFISDILPGSYVSNLEIFSIGDIITCVNNTKIHRLEELHAILEQSQNLKYITIKTQDNKQNILFVDKVLDQESDLSNKYSYIPTKVFTILSQKQQSFKYSLKNKSMS